MIYVALESVGLASFGEVNEQLARFRGLFANQMPAEHVEIMIDLVALSAAELQIVIGGIGRQPLFPTPVEIPMLRLALAKTDTLPTWPCRTPERIAGGEARVGDCFVFSGDLDKALSSEMRSPATLRAKFPDFIHGYVQLMTNTPLGRETLIQPETYFAEALIWRARLDVFEGHQDPLRTATSLREAAAVMGISGLLRG